MGMLSKSIAERPIRVLIIEDSAFYRQALTKMLSSVHRIEIIGTAIDGADAIMQVTKQRPDVITLDLEMPRVDGFVFLRWLMKNLPTPVVVVSSQSDQASVFMALELGAVDFLAKPAPLSTSQIMEMRDELIAKIITVSCIPIERLNPGILSYEEGLSLPVLPLRRQGRIFKEIELVAIGASTGGPTAIQSIVVQLPKGFPLPVAVTQHMPPGFTQYFAERLNKLSHIPVCEARLGDLLEKGRVYICPGGYHMVFQRSREEVRIQLNEKRDADRYVPSVDQMFSSACEIYPGRVLGIILTGMGNDGKIGMRKIKEGGGQTLAESEQTAVVYGMPKEVIEDGVVDKVLPLSHIAREIIRSISS